MTTAESRSAIVARRSRWAERVSRLDATAGALSAAAVFVGAMAARLPLGPGNTAVHHGYPFFAVGMAATLLAVARRSRRQAARWSALVAAIGLAYAVNALLIALLSYAVTPEGAGLPLGLLGWLADVFFPVCDVGFLGLLVGLLPDVRPRGGRRIAVAALGGLTLLTMLAEAFVPHILDSTQVDNPVALDGLAGLSDRFQLLVPLMFGYAVLLSVTTGVRLALESRRRDAGVGPSAWGAGVVLPLMFVGQAAIPETSWWGAGVVTLGGCLAASILASRVARALSPTRGRSILDGHPDAQPTTPGVAPHREEVPC